MKTYRLFENETEDFKTTLLNNVWDDENSGYHYLYHFTLTDNINSILEDGLIPRKYPNSNYENGCDGVFLTSKQDTYGANLPGILINILEDFYQEYYDEEGEVIGEEPSDSDSPLTIMKIRIDNLDFSLSNSDDDYNVYHSITDKENDRERHVLNSLTDYGAICYKGIIPEENIIDYFQIL